MKVAFILDDDITRRGGVQTYIVTLASWLSSRGHDVEVLSAGHPPEAHAFVHHTVPGTRTVRINGIDIGLALRRDAGQFLGHVKAGDFDVLHVQLPNMFTVSREAVSLASDRTAIVAGYYSVPYKLRDRLGLAMLGHVHRRHLARIDRFLAISATANLWLCQVFKVHGHVVPQPYSLPVGQIDRREIYTSHATHPIVYVGRLVPRKGCSQLIRAYALLAARDADVPDLQLIGGGSQEGELRSLARRLGVHERVEFLGEVSETSRVRSLAAADLAVFPSLGGEGWGSVLIEALAVGVPVIAGDVAAYRETVEGAPATFANAKRYQELATTMAASLNRTGKASDGEVRACQDFAKRYEVDTIGAVICEHYEAALAQRRRA